MKIIKDIFNEEKQIEKKLWKLLIKKYCTFLRKTCSACPTQWDGFTNDNEWFYFRYRRGNLQFTVWEKEMFKGKKIYERYIEKFNNDELDGCLVDITVLVLIKSFLEDYYYIKRN